MKRFWMTGFCAALLLCTACGEPSEVSGDAPADTPDGLTVHAAEDFDAAYSDCIKAYFEAIDRGDYEAYCAAMYPPYLAAYEAYLEENGTAPGDAFAELCARFDEDGYESWTLTDIDLSYYPEEKTDFDGFFNAYVSAGILPEDFAETCRAETEELRDIQFTLYALYAGDDAAVPVVSGSEIIAVRSPEGVFVFG